MRKIREKGVSLRVTSISMFVISLAIMIILLFTTVRTIQAFGRLASATDSFIDQEEAANELMRASDYLTEEAQCYTVVGTRDHLDNYLREAEVARRREASLAVLQQHSPGSAAFGKLQAAMAESLSLMETEYYAMRLVLEAQGEQDIPPALQDVVISEEDLALGKEGMLAKARLLMHNEEYYARKNRIRENMTNCLEELKSGTQGTQELTEQEAHRKLIGMTILIVVQSLACFIMLWVNTHLGIRPLLKAVDHIRLDERLPIVGAHEFRYLASTYNVMYSAYKKSIENLSFKASHDELTGVYNRAGYDLIKESVDLSTTAMLLFDVDNFKEINDQYGHETGDRVLKKIAQTLKAAFRSDDYIFRLGGDEFVAFMVHISPDRFGIIESKVKQINDGLSTPSDGLPTVSVSVGVAGCCEKTEADEVLSQADLALYYVKEHGRHNCCFYKEGMKKRKTESD